MMCVFQFYETWGFIVCKASLCWEFKHKHWVRILLLLLLLLCENLLTPMMVNFMFLLQLKDYMFLCGLRIFSDLLGLYKSLWKLTVTKLKQGCFSYCSSSEVKVSRNMRFSLNSNNMMTNQEEVIFSYLFACLPFCLPDSSSAIVLDLLNLPLLSKWKCHKHW